mmetsp:Transcript_4375/g.6555  ORF Transcript_4375/g.6555 Transcript_4375/m.6555 type:complete len:662 (+) Transcript_4375:103-2088(+)|eukprot:CAMPEP_0167762320 /NCGR_PEP_ID=MMETSP0110_2-20121227/12698_1 /TAXON_ID=629695 /ORGANISM="Gymnochlora sp., Strain CCMP2014" /LENGTH=661 /DNA_ID=CAMNT_0007649173 /DNA_START=70 /DNA_END=2055 /DNA_ORIENTATION=+
METGNDASEGYFMGADCGSGSVRVGICDSDGKLLASSKEDISTNNPRSGFYEQSSDEIWECLCRSAKAAMKKLPRVTPDKIKGIGFDATCSLVVLDKKDEPISVSTGYTPPGMADDNKWNVIMWRDHRASAETDFINSTKHEVLKYVGGQVSIEMEAPKLLWLKKNKPLTYKAAGRFMDLTDFLAYRATGIDVRSKCTTACKWTYLPHKATDSKNSTQGWSSDFWDSIGLGDIVDCKYSPIGSDVRHIGTAIGNGLTEKAAKELGLLKGTPVGVGLIDAHAGALGMLGAKISDEKGNEVPLERRLALVCGTSACHLTLSKKPYFVPGVWGPFRDAVVPGYWVLEPGQSAVGALMDFIIKSHWAYKFVKSEAEKNDMSVFDLLNDHLKTLKSLQQGSEGKLSTAPSLSGFEQVLPTASHYMDVVQMKKAIWEAKQGKPSPTPTAVNTKKIWRNKIAYLTKNLHCLPDYYGNRCPFADPTMRGMMSGLSVFNTAGAAKSAGMDELAIRYLAIMQALAYSTRQILESLESKGVPPVSVIFMCGGVSKNEVFVQQHADITGVRIATPRDDETVLIGAATAGACAGGSFKNLEDAMKSMSHVGSVTEPDKTLALALYHERKYQVFKRMYRDHLAYRAIMKGSPTSDVSTDSCATTQCATVPTCDIM